MPLKLIKLKNAWPKWLVWILALTLLVLLCIFGKWAWQPVILIITGVVATQAGSRYAQTTLQQLVEKLTYQDETESTQCSEDEKKITKALRESIEDRLRPAKRDGHDAVDSYLNQVAGSWAMAFLVIGIAGMLFLRPTLLGVENPKGITTVAVVALVVTILLIAWIVTMGIVGSSKEIIIYFGHKSKYPPSGALTVFRAAVLIIYSCLVFAAYWPKPPIIPDAGGNQSETINNMTSISTNNIQNKTAVPTTNTSPSFNTQ